jgi:hypothetical protein
MLYRLIFPFQHATYHPASRFRPLLSYMNKQCCRFLVPERELCVDETLVATKGHSIMRQYIQKPRNSESNCGCYVNQQRDISRKCLSTEVGILTRFRPFSCYKSFIYTKLSFWYKESAALFIHVRQ